MELVLLLSFLVLPDESDVLLVSDEDEELPPSDEEVEVSFLSEPAVDAVADFDPDRLSVL